MGSEACWRKYKRRSNAGQDQISSFFLFISCSSSKPFISLVLLFSESSLHIIPQSELDPRVSKQRLVLPSTPLLIIIIIVIIMPVAGTLYNPTHPSLPRAMPGKPASGPRGGALHPVPFRPAGSPPRAISYSPHTSSSVATSAVPSLTNGTCARSTHSDHDSSSSGGATSVDLIDLMTDRVSHAINPIPMDRSIAQQAQT